MCRDNVALLRLELEWMKYYFFFFLTVLAHLCLCFCPWRQGEIISVG